MERTEESVITKTKVKKNSIKKIERKYLHWGNGQKKVLSTKLMSKQLLLKKN